MFEELITLRKKIVIRLISGAMWSDQLLSITFLQAVSKHWAVPFIQNRCLHLYH